MHLSDKNIASFHPGAQISNLNTEGQSLNIKRAEGTAGSGLGNSSYKQAANEYKKHIEAARNGRYKIQQSPNYNSSF